MNITFLTRLIGGKRTMKPFNCFPVDKDRFLVDLPYTSLNGVQNNPGGCALKENWKLFEKWVTESFDLILHPEKAGLFSKRNRLS
jgi:hypothetical protein